MTAPAAVLDPPQLHVRAAPTFRRGDIATAVVLGAAILAFCCYAIHDGLPVGSAGRLLLVLVGVQWVPGVVVWRCVRPRAGWLVEDLACGFACGFALSVPAQVIGGRSDSAALSAGIPLLVAVMLLAIPASRRRFRAAQWQPTPWWLPVVIAGASLCAVTQLASYFRQNHLSWGTGIGHPHVDQAFQIALTGQLRHRGPGSWPMLLGQPLDYHWFAHAWMGQLASVAQVPTPQVVLRFAPAALVVLVAAAIAAFALRVGGSAGAASLTVVIAMAFNYVVCWHRTGAALPLNPLSPTLAPSIPPLLALCTLVVVRLRSERTIGNGVACLVLAIVAAGTKGSATPLVVAGLGLAAVAGARRRAGVRGVIVDFALVAAGLGICMKVVFNGSADGLTLDPRAAAGFSWPVAAVGGSTSSRVLLLGGIFLVLWGASKAVLAVVLLMRPDAHLGRRDPVVWFLVGAVVAGAFAPALFVQPGDSQAYFRIQALPVAAVLSGVGAQLWLRKAGAGRVGVAVCVAACAAYLAYRLPALIITVARHRPVQPYLILLIALLVAVAGGLAVAAVSGRWNARDVVAGAASVALLTGLWSAAGAQTHVARSIRPASIAAPGAVDQGQLAAAGYLNRHAATDAVIMTNRHCTTPRPVRGECDSRWFFVAAYSGRQLLVEGWGYSPPITAKYTKGRTSITAPFYNPGLLRLNDGFYRRPTESAAVQLWDKGVRWVYVDKATSPGVHLGGFATMQYQDSAASIWKLNRP